MTTALLASSISARSAPTATYPDISPPDTRISGEEFRSAGYTGIMTVVSPVSDPELFYANQALDNIIHVELGLEPYQYENKIDWSVGDKSNT